MATPCQAPGSPRKVSPVVSRRSLSQARSGGRRSLSVCRGGDPISVVSSGNCIHRLHNRLDNLRTLVLAGNHLKGVRLNATSVDPRPACPLLSMLDISNNKLLALSDEISELSWLSVLSIAHNNISSLPPSLAKLQRLWNLNLTECPLQEPLRSMVQERYLKFLNSVFELTK